MSSTARHFLLRYNRESIASVENLNYRACQHSVGYGWPSFVYQTADFDYQC